MARIRVLLADDQPIVLEGLTGLLEAEYEIAGTARDGLALIAEAQRTRPDLIIADITMPQRSGIDAAREIKAQIPNVVIVFLTMHSDMVYAVEALKAGGSAFVVKSSGGEELLTAIREALSGHRYVTPSLAARVFDALARQGTRRKRGLESLTKRQKEILRLVATGKTIDEIARSLQISRNTVKSHKQRLIDELQVHTTAGLTQYAVEHELVGTEHGDAG